MAVAISGTEHLLLLLLLLLLFGRFVSYWEPLLGNLAPFPKASLSPGTAP